MKNKEKRKEGKERKNTLEWSRTTGGRKEGTEEERWLCLVLAVKANRGFGNNWLSLIALPRLELHTHQSQSALPFAFHVECFSSLTVPLFLS
jgi:hypothetical protein